MRESTFYGWKVALCGLALVAFASLVAAKDITFNGSLVDVYTNVSALRDVPAPNALPGLHIDAKVKGRLVDIYIAPAKFAAKYGVKLAKGDDVRIVGMLVRSGDSETILAHEISLGQYDKRDGAFHETLTVYLRNDAGPFWIDDSAAEK
jgi:hypothetical protein